MNKNKKIFICCTEQSGENIVFNICQKLEKYNYQIDGVCGKSTEIADYYLRQPQGERGTTLLKNAFLVLIS